jgi:hypothetical protein
VFSDESEGWYVASARKMSSAANTSTSPSRIFQGRLRVGLDGRSGKLPRACRWSGRRVPEQSLLSPAESRIPGKRSGEEPCCGPPPNKGFSRAISRRYISPPRAAVRFPE